MMIMMALALAAGQSAQPPMRPRMDPDKRMERLFDMADTDRNGQLSRAELKAGMERMREHRMEMRERRGGPGGPGGMRRPGQ